MSAAGPRRALRHLPVAVRRRGFRRLLSVRLLGQFGDGLFQASLAEAVLFSPEHQPNAASIAAALAVILLPYSVVGPLAGVLLDRWWRQRVLQWSNLVRAGLVLGVAAEIAGGLSGPAFYASALVVISVNRFLLAALSAGLPHVVGADELVSANALATTAGALVTAAGLGLGVGIGGAGLGGAGFAGGQVGGSATGAAYGAVAVAAAVGYLAAGLAALRLGRRVLGPDDVERDQRESARQVLRGLRAGAAHVAHRPAARRALLMIAAHRLWFGVGLVTTVLLFRNYLHAQGPFRVGLAGLGQVVLAVAVGGFLAAVVTPRATRRLGLVRWSVVLLAGSAVVQVGLGLLYLAGSSLLAAMGLGFGAQGIKICVDTVVQTTVADAFRGRVFALYDTLFNLTAVVAAVVTAVIVPPDGHSPAVVLLLGLGYGVTAVVYRHRSDDGSAEAHQASNSSVACCLPIGPRSIRSASR